MKTEYEIRILEIDKESIIKLLEGLGAIKKGEYNQKRYVYDLKPVQNGKWIRLRTNGNETTLTYKDVVSMLYSFVYCFPHFFRVQKQLFL